MLDDLNFEERKRRYFESIESNPGPAEKSWWQYPPPSFYSTAEYTIKFPQEVNTAEPVTFKKPGNHALLAIVITIVAGTLLYILGNGSFGFIPFLFLGFILLGVMPPLLDTGVKIMISKAGIWLKKDDKTITWNNIVRTYIKEAQQEQAIYMLVVHYYDDRRDQFAEIETELDRSISPALLAVTIEAFRKQQS